MAVIKLSNIPLYSGDTSGSYLLINDSTNTTTYRVQKESLMSGSFEGTASYALTASYLSGYIEPFPYSGSAQITGSLGITGSLSLESGVANLTASQALTASYVEADNVVGLNLSRISSGSATASIQPGLFTINTDSLVQGSITASNALVTGTITAQTIYVQYITASTELVTGSTKFGTELSNTHQFTGSVGITGSLSLASGVASLTSSWAERATSSSYAVSASLSTLAGYSKIQETQYRLQNNTVLDQDLWLNQSTIYKIVTGSGLSTLEYKVNAGSYNALSFTGNTWTGTIAVNPLDELSWRITYKAGYTVASFVVVSNITVN